MGRLATLFSVHHTKTHEQSGEERRLWKGSHLVIKSPVWYILLAGQYTSVQATQVLAVKNRISTSDQPDVPVPGCSPMELLKGRRFIAGEEDFKVLRPYMQYVVKVPVISKKILWNWIENLQDILTTHVDDLKKFKREGLYQNLAEAASTLSIGPLFPNGNHPVTHPCAHQCANVQYRYI